MNKELKNTLDVISNCPKSYNQNIKTLRKSEKLEDYCLSNGFKPFTCFSSCSMWDKRQNCWGSYYDYIKHFNKHG
jgi:hypothetical protein